MSKAQMLSSNTPAPSATTTPGSSPPPKYEFFHVIQDYLDRAAALLDWGVAGLTTDSPELAALYGQGGAGAGNACDRPQPVERAGAATTASR